MTEKYRNLNKYVDQSNRIVAVTGAEALDAVLNR